MCRRIMLVYMLVGVSVNCELYGIVLYRLVHYANIETILSVWIEESLYLWQVSGCLKKFRHFSQTLAFKRYLIKVKGPRITRISYPSSACIVELLISAYSSLYKVLRFGKAIDVVSFLGLEL